MVILRATEVLVSAGWVAILGIKTSKEAVGTPSDQLPASAQSVVAFPAVHTVVVLVILMVPRPGPVKNVLLILAAPEPVLPYVPDVCVAPPSSKPLAVCANPFRSTVAPVLMIRLRSIAFATFNVMVPVLSITTPPVPENVVGNSSPVTNDAVLL